MADGTFQSFGWGEAMGKAMSAESTTQAQNAREQQRQQFELQRMQYENDRLDNRQMLRNQGKDSNSISMEQLQKKQEEMEAQRQEEMKARETSRGIAFNAAKTDAYKNGITAQNAHEINNSISQSEPSIAQVNGINAKLKEMDLEGKGSTLKYTDPNRTPMEAIQLLSIGNKNPDNKAAKELINLNLARDRHIRENTIFGRFKNLVTNGQFGADFSMKSESGEDEFAQAMFLEYYIKAVSNGQSPTLNDINNAYSTIPGAKDSNSLTSGMIEYVFGSGAYHKATEGIQSRIDSLLKDQDKGNKDFDNQRAAIQNKIVELESRVANKSADIGNKVDKFSEITDGLSNNQAERENAIAEKTAEIDELVKREDNLTEEEATKLANLRIELANLNKEHNKNKQLQDKVNRESENTTSKYNTAQAHAEGVSSAEWYTDSNNPEIKEMTALKNELRTLEQTQKEFNKGHNLELKELDEQFKNTRKTMEESALDIVKRDPDIIDLVYIDGSSYGTFDKDGNFIGDNLYAFNNLTYNSYESRKAQEAQLLNDTLEAQKKYTQLAQLKAGQAQSEGAYMQQQGYNQTAAERGFMQGQNELTALGMQHNQLMRGEELAQGQHQLDLINQNTAQGTTVTNNILSNNRNEAILNGDAKAANELGVRQDALAQGDFTSGKAGGVGMNPPPQTNTIVDGGQKLQGGTPSIPSTLSAPSTPSTPSTLSTPVATQNPNAKNIPFEFTQEQIEATKNGDLTHVDKAMDQIYKSLVEDKNYDYNMAFNDLQRIADIFGYKDLFKSPIATKSSKGKMLVDTIMSKYAGDTNNAERRTVDNTENLSNAVKFLTEGKLIQSTGSNIGSEIANTFSSFVADLGGDVSERDSNRRKLDGYLSQLAKAVNAANKPAVSTGSAYVNKEDTKNSIDFKRITSTNDLLNRLTESISIAEIALQTRVKNGNAIEAAKAKSGLADMEVARELVSMYTLMSNKGHLADAIISMGNRNGNFYIHKDKVYQIDSRGISELGGIDSRAVQTTASKTPDLARIIKEAKKAK